MGIKGDSSFCKSKKKQKLLKIPCEAPENSPASWCKKSGEASSSASADFLLEAEKRGTLPKSEKRSFWRVGRAGRGVQPFCEKKKSEIDKKIACESQNLKKSVDCHADSANLLAMTKI